MRVLITGASGSGTTTVGRSLAQAIDATYLDGDDYFWIASDPPFRAQREPRARLALALSHLHAAPRAVFSGSVVDWGDELEDAFALIVFLTLPADIRIERLREREARRFGQAHPGFIEWASRYDAGGVEGRTRAIHERWLAERSCPVLRIDGDLTNDERIVRIVKSLPGIIP